MLAGLVSSELPPSLAYKMATGLLPLHVVVLCAPGPLVSFVGPKDPGQIGRGPILMASF